MISIKLKYKEISADSTCYSYVYKIMPITSAPRHMLTKLRTRSVTTRSARSNFQGRSHAELLRPQFQLRNDGENQKLEFQKREEELKIYGREQLYQLP